jgi:shikimate dehydrogenase
MHNAAFRALGIRAFYVAVEIPPDYLPQMVDGVRRCARGFNVTIPFKVAIMNLLDRLDRTASLVEAVNTVVNRRGKLIGYNTDGAGAMMALEKELGSVRGMRVVVLGAGGAARAIAFALAQEGCQITIANRTLARAEALASILRRKLSVDVDVMGIEKSKLRRALGKADLLINATSVGMYPQHRRTLADASMLRRDLVVMDIVYKPLKTKLLREAEKAGCRTIDGLQMLVYQAALSFQLWTKRKPPIEVMKRAAEKAMGAET